MSQKGGPTLQQYGQMYHLFRIGLGEFSVTHPHTEPERVRISENLHQAIAGKKIGQPSSRDIGQQSYRPILSCSIKVDSLPRFFEGELQLPLEEEGACFRIEKECFSLYFPQSGIVQHIPFDPHEKGGQVMRELFEKTDLCASFPHTAFIDGNSYVMVFCNETEISFFLDLVLPYFFKDRIPKWRIYGDKTVVLQEVSHLPELFNRMKKRILPSFEPRTEKLLDISWAMEGQPLLQMTYFDKGLEHNNSLIWLGEQVWEKTVPLLGQLDSDPLLIERVREMYCLMGTMNRKGGPTIQEYIRLGKIFKQFLADALRLDPQIGEKLKELQKRKG